MFKVYQQFYLYAQDILKEKPAKFLADFHTEDKDEVHTSQTRTTDLFDVRLQ